MERPASARWVLGVAALSGAGTLVLELSAVRLVAPWFGASTPVWTNAIGVVLLALALGYLLGAQLSARENPERILAIALLGAAAATCFLPGLSGPVCKAFAVENLSLEGAAALLSWGSLAATLLLFLPPAILLGATSPLCVEILQRSRGSNAGAAGGEVLAASTVGSLAGTFATTHLLLPELGLRRSLAIAAALLAAPGLMLCLRSRMRGPAGIGLVLAGAGLALESAAPNLRSGQILLEQRESAYQSLRVVELQDQGAPARWLQVNEGFDSFQSAWKPASGLLGEGYYYDVFALPAWWARAQGPFSVLAIGLGAGTIQRVLSGALPPQAELRFCGVEIDPVVVELGRRWFGLDPGQGVVHAGWDGRAALRGLPGPFDMIALDAYANQVEIPAHLASREFFSQVRSALRPGGWLLANVGGFGFEDPVVKCMANTAAEAFGAPVLVLRVPAARNYVLVAREGGAPIAPDHPDWNLPSGIEPSGIATDLLAALRLPGAWRWFDAGHRPIATDDRNPIDALQRRSLLEARQRLRGRIE